MVVQIIKIENEFTIGGFSIISTDKEFSKDIEELHNDFIHNGKKELLNNITNDNLEYYEVSWYRSDKEGFEWLLGQKIKSKVENLKTKVIKKGEYAVAKFPPKHDTVKAWVDLYGEGILGIGYKAIEDDDVNVGFMYYPNGLDNEYELWALVEKA
jgi:hypothetical protein